MELAVRADVVPAVVVAVWTGAVLAQAERKVRARCHPHPGPVARRVRDHLASWHGIRLEGDAGPRVEGDPSRATRWLAPLQR